MPPGLWKLIRLQRRAALRRLLRGARTPRGAIFFIIGLMMLALWLVPGVVQATRMHGRVDPAPLLLYLPLGLLATCLAQVVTAAGERAVSFMPAEVDLLFPAPFTRRQLLAYKLVQSAVGATLVAAIFSLVWLQYSPHWIVAFIGYWLTLNFVQLVSMSMALIGQSIGATAFTRGRRLILLAVLAVVALAVFPAVRDGAQRSAAEWLSLFVSSRAGSALLAPFGVFARLIVAPTLLEGTRLGGIAIAMIGTLVFIVMWLDVRFEETAAAAGAQLYARLQRARRGAALIGPAGAGSARWRPPPFPRLGGAGPIARRQLTAALRQSRGIFVLIGIICAGGLIMMSAMHGEADITAPLVGALVWMTLLLTNNLRFDFRGDVDLIDTLKALPVRPMAVAIAELAAPVMVLWSSQVFLVGAAVLLKRVPPQVLPIAAAFALPMDAMLMALENLLFLLFPARLQVSGVGDMQGYGRQIVVLFAKMIVMLLAAGIAAGAGAVAYFGGGRSSAAFAITTAFVLSAEVIALIPLLAWAFQRFDVSIDTPT